MVPVSPYPPRQISPPSAISGYILDFYAPSLKLCIELDGPSHDSAEAQAYDAERSALLAGAGVQVVRFANADIEREFTAVCAAIDRACGGEWD